MDTDKPMSSIVNRSGDYISVTNKTREGKRDRKSEGEGEEVNGDNGEVTARSVRMPLSSHLSLSLTLSSLSL